jgi:hypothetical protein
VDLSDVAGACFGDAVLESNDRRDLEFKLLPRKRPELIRT